MYGACGVSGFLLGMLYLFFACKKYHEDFGNLVYVYVWSALGAILGAKILYLLIEIRTIVSILVTYGLTLNGLSELLGGGFVFYGGLFGALIAAVLASNYFHLEKKHTIPILTPALPLAHAFGRIGCAMVGCCYGMEIEHGIGIIYRRSKYAPNGVKLFPVQAVEACGDLIIFCVLLKVLSKTLQKKDSGGIVLQIYLACYAIMRFFLEFFRGDQIRGGLWKLSTSQWISLLILGGVAAYKLVAGRKIVRLQR